jgi:hypothetical protein
VGSWTLTGLAAALTLLALTVPSRLHELTPGIFLRLPLEALLLLAVAVLLPSRWARTRTALAITAGLVLGLGAVLRLLDVGFFEALNRPFDLLIDWQYAGELVETTHDSVGVGVGNALLLVAALVALALVVLLPLAVLRLVRVAGRHRRPVGRVVVALLCLWLVLAVLDVRAGPRPMASADASRYLVDQVDRLSGELDEMRRFDRDVARDPLERVDPRDALAGLRGKDVLLVFVESFGRVAVEGSSFSARINRVLDSGTRRLADAGFESRTAFMTSPTFGALSWLAHATLQSGLWVDSQPLYDRMVESRRLTLTRLFGRAGWRTVIDVPANTRSWPQGEFYGADQLYDSRNVGYEGPKFGYPPVPDQYTLDAFHRLELARQDRPPVMAEIDLITSHAPWSRTPRMVPQAEVGDGSIFDGMPETLPSEGDIWPSPRRVKAAYAGSIEYSLEAFITFMTTYADDDLVVVLVGDHQPATIVSGRDAGRDVPVAFIARDPAVLDRIEHWGWRQGLRPTPDAPVWPMHAFRDRFVAAFDASRHTGSVALSGR